MNVGGSIDEGEQARGAGSASLSFIVADPGDDGLLKAVVYSLAPSYQRYCAEEAYEVVIVAARRRASAVDAVLQDANPQARLVTTQEDVASPLSGIGHVSAEAVGLFSRPGIASPILVATIRAALDLYPGAALIVPTFPLGMGADTTIEAWAAKLDWPKDDEGLNRAAMLRPKGPRYKWLDPVEDPANVVAPRTALQSGSVRPQALTRDDWRSLCGQCVQLVGDGLVRPDRELSPGAAAERSSDAELKLVDGGLSFFGTVRALWRCPIPALPTFKRRTRPKLSVIVVTHDMRREAPRTLKSLQPGYQRGMAEEDYEVILVDNSSSTPLSAAEVAAVAPRAQYHVLRDPPPSPAYALNFGVKHAAGDVVALMIDGASLLSPGLLAGGLEAFRCFPRPVVITQYFYLGPGRQNETILQGYDKAEEDRLLAQIAWPEDGYRLFEIAWPLQFSGQGIWLGGWLECNCLMMRRSLFHELGGYDERFDLPGGGLVSIDFHLRSYARDVQLVKLLGEATFHQLHGGITTNISPEVQEQRVRTYMAQYENIRGPFPKSLNKVFVFMGRLPNAASRANMID